MPATTAEIIALAATIATEQHPEAFGTIDDFDAHQAKVANLEERITGYLDRFEGVLSGDDLAFDWSGLTPTERDRGLCRATFRRHKHVTLSPGWPKRLLDDAWRKRARRVDRQEPEVEVEVEAVA